MTDYLDPEASFPDHHAEEAEREIERRLAAADDARLQWRPALVQLTVCQSCRLEQREHINNRFCPEWRLRQLSGDR